MSQAFRSQTAKRSWGRVVEAHHDVAKPESPTEAVAILSEVANRKMSALPIGLGRSYGDSNLNPDGALIETTRLDHYIGFDPKTGVLRAEAGVSLNDLLRVVVPHGWFLPTTPGTRYVTLGGAIANDVHGKNHHIAGSFGSHVLRFTLARTDKGVLDVDPETPGDLFAATIGGLGLTGLILDVDLQLVPIRSAFLDQHVEPLRNVDAFFEIAEARAADYEHTVAWIDCTARGDRLGQGVFTSGNWAASGGLTPHDAKSGPGLPVDAPGFALNRLTLRAFNMTYRRSQLLKPRNSRVHYAGFFHPLDAIRDWNRLYGSRGFYQYQSVIPSETAREATREMLDLIARSGQGSFLAVLKTLGDRPSPGLMSFPMRGVTLALDFANAGSKTTALLADLDAIVKTAGGRLYPAKDGRMPADIFQQGYPEWERVEALRDPALSSAFWRRVTS
ncbi:FAD-binding oxidoreductase [Maricaulis sp.]|uniref:FAD-binding oxidoreductase n=1 Tax=Maricaulis sp. TaxID=1486257 RepID=UPI0025C503E9|nr:FAD-binding oxidoreductase [Maricaulis sp.]